MSKLWRGIGWGLLFTLPLWGGATVGVLLVVLVENR